MGFRAVNEFKVPKKAWESWTLVARHTFNKLYKDMSTNPWVYHHSVLMNSVPNDKHWKVTAWNAAFMAASIISRGERHILADLSNKVKGK